MKINKWDKLTRRQRVIRQSMVAYRFVLMGVKPWHFLTWNLEDK